MPNYKAIAADCEIIAQKIESLRAALKGDTSAKGERIESQLWRANSAIEQAKEAAQ